MSFASPIWKFYTRYRLFPENVSPNLLWFQNRSGDLGTGWYGMRERCGGRAAEIATSTLCDCFRSPADGLHGVIGDAGILEVLEAAEAPAQTTQKLILAARAQGAPDNTSTIIVDYGERRFRLNG